MRAAAKGPTISAMDSDRDDDATDRGYEDETTEGRLDAIEARLDEIRSRVGFPYVKITLLLGAFYLLGKLL